MRSYHHHIGDFNNATRHLDRIERSIYRDLIELYYDIEGPLPLDIPTICRRILARSNEESTVVERSLNEFFTKTPTGWYHDRCEAEIEKFRNGNSQRAQAGRASAAKKALKRQQALNGNSTGVEVSLNENTTDQHNQEPITINHKPLDKPRRAALSLSAWHSQPSVQVFKDWQAMRKAKRAPVSQTVIDKLTPEINSANAQGYSADDCLSLCVVKGWQGFKFDWLKNEEANHAGNQYRARPTRGERDEQALRNYLAGLDEQENAGAGMGHVVEQTVGI